MTHALLLKQVASVLHKHTGAGFADVLTLVLAAAAARVNSQARAPP
jgi:hypothetical protein